jgi:hypothetical protein
MQIAKRERRMRILRAIRERNKMVKERNCSPQDTADGHTITHNPPEEHHLISEDKNRLLKLVDWLAEHRGDLSLKVGWHFEVLSRPHTTSF